LLLIGGRTGQVAAPLLGVVLALVANQAAICQDSQDGDFASDKEANRAEALFNKGHRSLNHKNFVGAENLYRKAIAMNPGEPKYHRQLGLLLLGEGRVQEAEREVRFALDNDQNEWRSLVLLGQIMHAQGRAEEEVYTYNKVLKLLPPEESDLRSRIQTFLAQRAQGVKKRAEIAKRKKEFEEREFSRAY